MYGTKGAILSGVVELLWQSVGRILLWEWAGDCKNTSKWSILCFFHTTLRHNMPCEGLCICSGLVVRYVLVCVRVVDCLWLNKDEVWKSEKNNADDGVGEKWAFVCLCGVDVVLLALQKHYYDNYWCVGGSGRGLIYHAGNWIARSKCNIVVLSFVIMHGFVGSLLPDGGW